MKYKRYSLELKERVVTEYSKGGVSIAKLAEMNGINCNTVANWIKAARECRNASDGNAVIDVTSAIRSLATVSEPHEPETVSFRLNGSFEIETRKENLKAFLEAMRDAGM